MKINYKVILESPAVSSSLGVIGKDTDITVKKNLNGEIYINAKHIKGILRERVRQFKLALDESEKKTEIFLNKYFGSEGNSDFKEEKQKLRFSNLYLEENKKCNIYSRHSVQIDRKTKSAKEGSLFDYEFIEKETELTGSVIVSDDMDKNDLEFIVASLFHLDFIGGLKSRGLGKVRVEIEGKDISQLKNVVKQITKSKRENKKIDISKSKFKKYNYTLTLEEPLIIKGKEQGNYISVRDSIQGSTIRGAVINYFVQNYGINFENLLKIEASPVYRDGIRFASEFKTKYPVNGKIERRDKVVYSENQVENIKLERDNLEAPAYIGNEVSICIDPATKSVTHKKLFNTEFVEEFKNTQLKGDIILPEQLINDGDTITIYLGKYKSKGFGKATMKFSKYKSNIKGVNKKINKLNNLIQKEGSGKAGTTYITFDLISDLILPFPQIYDVAEQFKLLNGLGDNFKFESAKSFINTGKLQGYSILNKTRKMDEIVINKGSVITYSIDDKDVKNEMKLLDKIENNSCGLRQREGFGRISVCSVRNSMGFNQTSDNKPKPPVVSKKEKLFTEIIEEYFKESLAKLNPAQMNRFHSMVKNRNYYLHSNKILEFINKQIERGETTENEQLRKNKDFYIAFRDKIVNNIDLTAEEGEMIMSFIKKYTRYEIGRRKIAAILEEEN